MSSVLVSPSLKRRFSSMTRPPGRRAAIAWCADGPTTSAASFTRWPSSSPRRAATGASEYLGSGLPPGRAKGAAKINLAVHGEPTEAGRDRRQRVPRVGSAPGAAKVSANDHLGVAGRQRGQGGQASPDAAVVYDAAAVERHVEVGAHEDVPALDRQIIYRLHHGISFEPGAQARGK